MSKKLITTDELLALLIHSEVKMMSTHILGLPYDSLKKIIYPHPRYKTFTITKRNGSDRIIHEPRKNLKVIQDKILAYLYKLAAPAKPCVHGFTHRRSIVTNAKAHCAGKTNIILNLDLEDFFPSINFYRVRGLFQSAPFNFSYSVSTVLAHICTFNGELPQGAPTSPLIANLICRSVDKDLMKLASRHRATYTRYADDLTFSFSVKNTERLPANICIFDSGVLQLGEELKEIIKSHSFRINANKSRLSTRLHRLEVTGITVNEFPNVKRIFIDRIRGALHAWDVYGYALAQATWEMKTADIKSSPYKDRLWKRQRRTDAIPPLKNVLWGKLLYLRMVRGRADVIYTKLAQRYNELCEREEKAGGFNYSRLPVDVIVHSQVDAENAIFIVEWFGDYLDPKTSKSHFVGRQGTAFAYKDHGLITCNHVLKFEDDSIHADVECSDIKNLEFTVNHAKSGKKFPVEVVYRDSALDLAVIKFKEHPPNHNHFVEVDHKIKVGDEGVLIGFPNHSAGKPPDFLTTKVLNAYGRGGLQRLAITDTIRAGNSGGPLVDKAYRLAGVAQQGAKQDSGNNECLSVAELDKWLKKMGEADSLISESIVDETIPHL